MNARRHGNYRRALDIVAAVDSDWLSPPARQILEDLAEHMLLCRDADPADVVELREDASVTVMELAGAGLFPPPVADELIRLLLAAGPPLASRRVAA